MFRGPRQLILASCLFLTSSAKASAVEAFRHELRDHLARTKGCGVAVAIVTRDGPNLLDACRLDRGSIVGLFRRVEVNFSLREVVADANPRVTRLPENHRVPRLRVRISPIEGLKWFCVSTGYIFSDFF